MKTGLLAAVLFVIPLHAEIVDRIVTVVDGRVITWSAALEEANYQAFRKGQDPVESLDGDLLRKVVSQMIDQALLEKEMESSPFSPPGDRDTQGSLEQLRSRFPSPEEFQKSLTRHRLTEPALAQRLSKESAILAFIDFHLRPQAQPTPEMVETYYTETLVPQARSAGQSEATPLPQVSEKIEQILTEREINRLLDEWLQELRSRARIKLK